jgi:transposase
MSSQRYSPEFKDEAVRQVLERGYSVSEVASRLGVSAHSLHKRVKATKPDKSAEQGKDSLLEMRNIIVNLWEFPTALIQS